jgi:DNA-binding NtrC family response regulator
MGTERTLTYADTPSRSGSMVPAPYLVVAFDRHAPLAPPWRLSLAELDALKIGRADERRTKTAQDGATRWLVLGLCDRFMSSAHAELRRDWSGWRVRDAGSKNGIFVNGAPVAEAPLRDRDVLEVGGTMFVFRDQAWRAPDADVELALEPGATGPWTTMSLPLTGLFGELAKIAATTAPLLIRGASGTGKDVMARAVHERSGRVGPFVAVNCGAIPESLVESQLFGHRRGAFSGADRDYPGLIRTADRGTLFLDEVAELPASAQAALLRALQEGEVLPVGATRPVAVDARLVAATHQDLAQMVEDGAFRQDLYARVRGFDLELPALADRREDLGLLIATVLRRIAGERAPATKFARSAARALFNYDYPMNVRELEHALRAAHALTADEIELEHLPATMHIAAANRVVRAASERRPAPIPDDRRQAIERELRLAAGNISAAARALGLSRVHLHRLLAKLGIDPSDFR